ncbi:hypothetical protein BOX15_Mlig004458g2 [Macrostomum lignano]|uniref:Peptidase M14 domain-containing protein n=3 Tax=Macrostomum lignano TaxID=282301 RepID=A0A267DXA2_9PLAT|nr:hypothetical protein BOX15_Mlig004458g2 [Macrostomum lignano]
MFAPNRQYDSHSGTRFYDYSNESPYDSFMKKHLQHYGYYTGKNEKRIKDLEGWESDSTPDYKEYGSDDDYLNEALKDKERQEKELKSNQVVYNVNDGKVVTKLKEPRALFSGAQDAGLQPAKWPIEMEVLPDRVLHVDCPPEAPEPFGSSAAFEPTPVVQGEDSSSESSRLVFKYEPVLSPFFIKSRAGGSRTLSVCQIRDGQSDDSLVFESRFESGNLRRAYRVGPRDYELWLRTDLYTSKHTQWFYFRVSNTEPGQAYRFTLVNFYKSASLYNEGLRPLMYSCRAAKLRGAGWRRCGSGIKYFKSNQRYTAANGSEKFYYSLTWQTRFEFPDDTVYFAHCYPYTYSDLLDYLQSLQADPVVSGFCKQRVLCRSLAGNAVHLLTIGTPEEPPKGGAKPQQQQSRKPVILVTSRVHPGESNASWMMKGFLDHLTGQHPDACLLRDCFTFKVVPMINPDGVIVGNYRCSLAGRDLNRNYRSPLRDSFPAVCAIVDLVSRLQARGVRVALYCDLHGHSRRQNVFMYGCAPDKSLPVSERLSERVFPAMMSRNAPDKFEQDSCKFRMQKSKEGTGRIVMYRLGIRCAYTMEATFCGSTLGGLAGFHFTCRHLEQMGAHLCDSMLDYFDPSGAKRDRILSELERRLRVQILINLQRSGLAAELSDPEQLDLANLPDIVAADGSAADDPEEVGDSSDDGGSDSSVSDGLPAHFEFMRKAGGPAGGRGLGASGRRKKRRSRKELAAAAGAVAQRRVSKATAGSAAPAAKRPIFCDHCGSARCTHSQQPTGDKSVPSAPGSRQKSRASQQANRGDAITMATTPTTSGQQPQPGRIRSAVTVERLDEGLKPVASDPAIQTATAAASAAVSVGHGCESPQNVLQQQQQQQQQQPPQPPRNSIELLEVEAQQQQQQPQPMAIKPHHRLLEQSRPAQRTMHYDSEQTSLTDQPLGPASALSRAVSLDESNSRIGGRRSKAAAATAASAGGAAQPAAALQGQPGVPSLAAAAALTESVDSSNTRLLASNRVRMRHRLPGHRVGPPTAVTLATSGPGAPAEASVPNSVAQTATTTMATTNWRSLVAATPGPSSVLSAAAAAETVAEASTSGFKTAESPAVRSGDEPEPAAEQLLPNRVESGSPAPLFQQSAAQQQRDAQPLSAPKSPPMVPASSTAETIKTTMGVDEVMTAEASSCSETGPSSHSSPKQQQHQRRPSQWRQPPVGQEIAQTFSQPTVVLSSGNKPPVPQLASGQSRPATISLQMPAPRQSPGASLLVPRLPVAAEAARRLSQFRATRRSQHP